MTLDVLAPGISEKQRRCAIAAAQLIFQARGVTPEAAAMALAPYLPQELETPASVRAAAVWRHATQAANKACIDDSQTMVATLLVTP